ncbi:MAG TPA: ATP-binding protein [Atribacteraceae bacterium]|nr:ATP-binding protein [Atribacteraceae bacterium]
MTRLDSDFVRYFLRNLRRFLSASFVVLVSGEKRVPVCYSGLHRYRASLRNILSMLPPGKREETLRLTVARDRALTVRVLYLGESGLLLVGNSENEDHEFLKIPLPGRERRVLERFLIKIGEESGLDVESALFSYSFFSRIPFGLLVMDFQGKIIEWNEKMAILSGWSRQQVLGHRYSEYLLCDVPLESLLRGLLFGDSLFLRNYRFMSRHQEEILMNVHLFLWERDERFPRVVFVVEDVTEKARLGENVRQIEKLSTLGRFISGIAHEINNPLAVIYGYSQMLLQSLDRETADCRECKTVRRGLERIEDEAEHCGKLIQNLIDFSKPTSLHRELTDINLLVKESLNLMDIYLLQGRKTEFSLAPDLPEIMVDRLKLKQVFINLAKNAFEAMTGETGRMLLSTRLRTLSSLPGKDLSLVLSATENRRQDGLRFVQIIFSDNGEGISRDKIPHIFEPFYTTRDRGTGLGLSICYGIVKTHGGWIEIDSPCENERGTTVTIFLPVEAKTS